MNWLRKQKQKAKQQQRKQALTGYTSSGPLTGSQGTGYQETKASSALPLLIVSALDKITLEQWITCDCDNDLSPLIISGTPTREQLADAWLSLVSEYQALTATAGDEKNITSPAKIEALNTKIIVIEALVEALREDYHPELTEQLQAWGYDLPFTEQSLQKDLNKVSARLGNEKTKLAMEKQKLADYLENKEDNGPATKESYMKLLLHIEEHRKMTFDPCSLNMYKFGLMHKQLADYSILTAKKANKWQ